MRKTKTAYCFDTVSKVYMGTSFAIEDPEAKGKYQLPANSTYTKPPKTKDGEVAQYIDGKWAKKKAYYNVPVYDIETGVYTKLNYIDEMPERFIADLPKEDPYVKYTYTKGKFKVNEGASLELLRVKRNSLLMESDVYLISDHPVFIEYGEDVIREYRTALRNYPDTIDFKSKQLEIAFPKIGDFK